MKKLILGEEPHALSGRNGLFFHPRMDYRMNYEDEK